MEISNIIQAVLVGILVIVTGYYAYQTRRQANLLKEQIDENREAREKDEKIRSLDILSNWAMGIINSFGKLREEKEVYNADDLERIIRPYMIQSTQLISDTESFINDDLHKACLKASKYLVEAYKSKDKNLANIISNVINLMMELLIVISDERAKL